MAAAKTWRTVTVVPAEAALAGVEAGVVGGAGPGGVIGLGVPGVAAAVAVTVSFWPPEQWPGMPQTKEFDPATRVMLSFPVCTLLVEVSVQEA